jgi:glycosyltransferase involved in cell wall biosynthesis
MADGRELQLLSVVVPLHDEEGTVRELYARVCRGLDGLPFELVLVDDASRDLTGEMLAGLAAEDPRVRVIHLSRNFGHQAALTAGLEHARGEAVAMLDGDLQDPPELIARMVEHWRSGSDVVYGVRTERRGEARMKLTTARWFYRLFARVADVDLRANSGDFRLLDRRALDALLRMRERNRFLRGMTAWIGFTQTAVPYERDPRYAGSTPSPRSRGCRSSSRRSSGSCSRPSRCSRSRWSSACDLPGRRSPGSPPSCAWSC